MAHCNGDVYIFYNLYSLMSSPGRPPVLFDLGFRIFFLCAGLYSILAVGLWTLVYYNRGTLPVSSITLFQWHAHEMVYGYALAVIAGFLLTATATWTGQRTLHGWPLAGLACIWCVARGLFLSGNVLHSGILDFMFIGLLSVAVIRPIVKARQHRQAGIIAKLLMFLPGIVVFLLGAKGVMEYGTQLGVYGGLYLIIGLILMMGRRVVPMFIKSGIEETVNPTNPCWLDFASLVLYLVFFISMLIPAGTAVAGWTALLLCIVNAWRLLCWHTPGIWRKPLVWVIYLGLWFITLGFLLMFLAHYNYVSQFIAVHAFAYGGVGLMTLGMMARVSLGHTGRSIHEPPVLIQIAFGVLALGAVVRVIFPVLIPVVDYTWWVGLSQGMWIISYALFIVVYSPMLVRQRVDGRAL